MGLMALALYKGEMAEAAHQEAFGHSAEIGDDLRALVGANHDGKAPEAPPRPPGAVSVATSNFIHGAMSVRNNYQQIMCASRMVHGGQFAPGMGMGMPHPGRQAGGPEFG